MWTALDLKSDIYTQYSKFSNLCAKVCKSHESSVDDSSGVGHVEFGFSNFCSTSVLEKESLSKKTPRVLLETSVLQSKGFSLISSILILHSTYVSTLSPTSQFVWKWGKQMSFFISTSDKIPSFLLHLTNPFISSTCYDVITRGLEWGGFHWRRRRRSRGDKMKPGL